MATFHNQHLICPACGFAYLLQGQQAMKACPGVAIIQQCPECNKTVKVLCSNLSESDARHPTVDTSSSNFTHRPDQQTSQRRWKHQASNASRGSDGVPSNLATVWAPIVATALALIILITVCRTSTWSGQLTPARSAGALLLNDGVLKLAIAGHGIAGVLMLAGMLTVLYFTHLRVCGVSVSGATYIFGVALTAFIGIAAVFMLQAYGTWAWDLMSDGIGRHPRGGGGRATILWGLFVAVPAWMASTYARLEMDLSSIELTWNFFAGVGMFEEAAKAFAGVTLFQLANGPANRDMKYQRALCISCCFVAGLGFGAGEALLYFGQYHLADMGLATYTLRSWWCVPLHASWAMLSGLLLRPIAAREVTPSSLEGGYTGIVLLTLVFASAILPAAFLHGCYNAAAVKQSPMCWFWGLISLSFGLLVLCRFVHMGNTCDSHTGPHK